MTQIEHTMLAAAMDTFGGAETIRMRELPLPKTGPGEVLIRVEAAGVGSWDAVEREGGYEAVFGVPPTFPYVLGWDGAGTVAAVGADVADFSPGDRVYAATMPLPRGGFYAQYTVVAQEHVARIPTGLAVEQAAAMPWDALTAVSGLDALELHPGQPVMVFGASGGIGHLTLQLAKQQGARVFAVASGADGVALALQLGADLVVDGRREDVAATARAFAPDGLDAAVVTAGGEAVEAALSTVRDGGRVALPNGVSPEPRTRPAVQLVRYDGARDRAATDRLNRLIESRAFAVHIDRIFTLDQAADAHRFIAGHYLGKVVLRIT